MRIVIGIHGEIRKYLYFSGRDHLLNCRSMSFISQNRSELLPDSHIEVQGTLWNTARYPYLDIWDLQNWGKINRTTTFPNEIINWLLKVLKILWKREGIAPFFHNNFILLLQFHVNTGTIVSLRDQPSRDNESRLYFNEQPVKFSNQTSLFRDFTQVHCVCTCV